MDKQAYLAQIDRVIDAGDGWGPHGQKIGRFNDDAAADDFCVDYVKVYQNENYLSAVQPDSDFSGSFDLDEKRYAKKCLAAAGRFLLRIGMCL